MAAPVGYGTGRPRRRARTTCIRLAGFAGAVALVAGCAGSTGSSGSTGSTGSSNTAVAGTPGRAAIAVPQPASGQAGGAAAAAQATGAPRNAAAGSGAASAAGAAGAAVLPALADRSVIRTASIQVRVADVVASAGRAAELAAGAGGYVSAEQTQADPDHPDQSSAVVTLRIPGTSLPQVLTGLAHMGALLSQDQSSTDVTGQVIDVAARLASQQASVDRIRALLAQATTIGEVVSIEGELATREGALESLQAQAKALADQTSLATVTATLVGPQAAVVAPPAPRKGFASGLSQGWAAFSAATTWLLTAVGAALPFAVLAAVAAWLALVVRRRRPAGPAGRDDAEPDLA